MQPKLYVSSKTTHKIVPKTHQISRLEPILELWKKKIFLFFNFLFSNSLYNKCRLKESKYIMFKMFSIWIFGNVCSWRHLLVCLLRFVCLQNLFHCSMWFYLELFFWKWFEDIWSYYPFFGFNGAFRFLFVSIQFLKHFCSGFWSPLIWSSAMIFFFLIQSDWSGIFWKFIKLPILLNTAKKRIQFYL